MPARPRLAEELEPMQKAAGMPPNSKIRIDNVLLLVFILPGHAPANPDIYSLLDQLLFSRNYFSFLPACYFFNNLFKNLFSNAAVQLAASCCPQAQRFGDLLPDCIPYIYKFTKAPAKCRNIMRKSRAALWRLQEGHCAASR